MRALLQRQEKEERKKEEIIEGSIEYILDMSHTLYAIFVAMPDREACPKALDLAPITVRCAGVIDAGVGVVHAAFTFKRRGHAKCV